VLHRRGHQWLDDVISPRVAPCGSVMTANRPPG
jgi:hypothetical protein